MKTAALIAALAIAALVSGCGGSSSSPQTTTAAPASSRVTVAQLAQAFIDWDGVSTHAFKASGGGCDRLAVRDTGSRYFAALVVVSPSEACDSTMSVEKGSTARWVQGNVWVEWPKGTGMAAKTVVHASAMAAYVTLIVK